MKKRSEKQEDLDKLKVVLAKVSTVILTTFQGITVEDDTKLRRAVQAAGGNYQVVKNTLGGARRFGHSRRRLAEESERHELDRLHRTPIRSRLAKALTKVAKDVPAFQFRAGVVEGRVISIAEIQQLANLPSKEELISKIMFLLNAPAQRIASGAERAAAQRRRGGQRSGEGRQVWFGRSGQQLRHRVPKRPSKEFSKEFQ